jgi:hypothetical protein|tara:strand:- start:2182 stop:2400 length:219 start_codon:yes stop_codon:yes gene_type:complete
MGMKPSVPKPPQPDTRLADMEIAEQEKLQEEQERSLKVARQGRSFLIQSSPQGVTEEANVAKSFLGSGNRYT